MIEITEALCKSPLLRKRPKLAALLRHLAIHNDEPDRLTASAIMRALGFESPETVRIQCTRLRAALRYHYVYCREETTTKDELDLPDAASNDFDVHDRHRRYRLVQGVGLHGSNGAEAFWQAHLAVRRGERGDLVSGTTIVFTEPLMFRDTKNRFFIRHLDVNDEEEIPLGGVQHDPVEALAQRVPWMVRDRKSIVISRGYVPGGEVIAKDKLRLWLATQLEWTKHAGGHVISPTPFVQERISRKVTDINDLKGSHCILLGSARANWVLRYFQGQAKPLLRCRIEPEGLVVEKCTDHEFRSVRSILNEIKGNDIRDNDLATMVIRKGHNLYLRDDWAKLSFAMVTRAFDHSGKFVITALAANQGRGIQALGEYILVEDEQADETFGRLGIALPLPKAFQMIFAVVLEDQESGYSKSRWRPLLFWPVLPPPHSAESKASRVARPQRR